MARAFGLHGERVTDPARLPGALARRVRERAGAARRRRHAGRAVAPTPARASAGCRISRRSTAWDDAEQARRDGRPRRRARGIAPREAAMTTCSMSAQIVAAHARLAAGQDRRARLAARADLRAVERARQPPRQRAARPRAAPRATASRCSPTTASSGWRSTSRWRKAGLVAVPINFRLVAAGDRLHRRATARRARSSCRTTLVERIEPVRANLPLIRRGAWIHFGGTRTPRGWTRLRGADRRRRRRRRPACA